MPASLYTGPVGSGKTYGVIRAALKSKLRNVWLPRNLVVDFSGTDKIARYYDHISEIKDARCAFIIVDEAHHYLDARNWSSLDPAFRAHIHEHRKAHCEYAFATQHTDFLDKVVRTFLDDVHVSEGTQWPFVGWIWPGSKIAPVLCPYGCCEVMPDVIPTYPSFGRVFRVQVMRPSYLVGQEDIQAAVLQAEYREALSKQGADVEDAPPSPPSPFLRSYTHVFDPTIAARYSTHGLIHV